MPGKKLVNADGSDASIGDIIICTDPRTNTQEEIDQYMKEKGLRWEDIPMLLTVTAPLILQPEHFDVIAKFLEYSFTDINFEYDGLTDREKAICTKEVFDRIVIWVRNHGKKALIGQGTLTIKED